MTSSFAIIFQRSLSSGLNKTNAQAKQNTTLLTRFFACKSNISCLFSPSIISNYFDILMCNTLLSCSTIQGICDVLKSAITWQARLGADYHGMAASTLAKLSTIRKLLGSFEGQRHLHKVIQSGCLATSVFCICNCGKQNRNNYPCSQEVKKTQLGFVSNVLAS